MLGADADYQRLRRTGQPGWGGEHHARRLAGWIETLDRLGASRLVPAPPARALDVGCGNGTVSLEMARRGYQVDGIDLSGEAIDWAVERARDAGLQASFRHGDVCTMPYFDSGAFDLVIDGNCLHCLIGAARQRCLGEIRRVLRAGGAFVVSTMCGEPRSLDPRDRHDRASGVLFRNGEPYRSLKTASAIESELRAGGFRIVDRALAHNPWWDHLTQVCVPE